jgi:SAM-dependent methyltransferase
MHSTAMQNCQSFFDAYTPVLTARQHVKVIEIGSQNVNGTLRDTCPSHFEYIGVDFQDAKGVDLVLQDPYLLPFENESVDVVLSSSCFEHSEMFWLVFLEILRVLKPNGLFYLNAPSTGSFHRYPVDCWRFYPDSGMALVNWAKKSGINAALLESYTQKSRDWQDYVAVFLKDESWSQEFPQRILDEKADFENGQLLSSTQLLNFHDTSQHETILCENEHNTALANAAHSAKIKELESEINRLQSLVAAPPYAQANAQIELSNLQTKIQQMKASSSWRITAPLRALKKLLG